MKHLASGDPKFVTLWHTICDEKEEEEKEWIKNLREAGFKAAHPNDGWVDRDAKEICLVYPQFNDGIDIGDAIMLGWPFDKKSCRPVKVIGKKPSFVGGFVYWQFEDLVSE